MHAARFRLTNDHAPSAHPTVLTAGMVVCPVAMWACPVEASRWMQDVYRMAYEQARAALAPTWYDRASVPSRN